MLIYQKATMIKPIENGGLMVFDNGLEGIRQKTWRFYKMLVQ